MQPSLIELNAMQFHAGIVDLRVERLPGFKFTGKIGKAGKR